jgi:hypothetical protein
MNFNGRYQKRIYLHGVQGVGSSSLLAPTNRIKHLANSSELAFCFGVAYKKKVPNKVPNSSIS